MASVNQTRPHCVNQMGKTHSKPLAARHGRGTAWARHAMCKSALRVTSTREVAVLLQFMSVDLLGWSIAPKKFVLFVLHELAQSVQKNIYIIKLDCMRVRSVYRSPLVYKDNT